MSDISEFSLAACVARRVSERWCGWVEQMKCVKWQIATERRDSAGHRVWVTVGTASLEYLELLGTFSERVRERAIDKLVRQILRTIDNFEINIPKE